MGKLTCKKVLCSLESPESPASSETADPLLRTGKPDRYLMVANMAAGSSRLIVKNLPNSVNEDKLRTSFATRGEVTDVQLKYTKDKKFRHFGFVGFKTQAAAESAKNHFHNTFMGATKISVEFCADW